MAKVCSQCGNILKDDIRFCPKCGNNVFSAIKEKQPADNFNNQYTVPQNRYTAPVQSINQNTVTETAVKTGKFSVKILILIGVAVLVAVAAAAAIISFSDSGYKNFAKNYVQDYVNGENVLEYYFPSVQTLEKATIQEYGGTIEQYYDDAERFYASELQEEDVKIENLNDLYKYKGKNIRKTFENNLGKDYSIKELKITDTEKWSEKKVKQSKESFDELKKEGYDIDGDKLKEVYEVNIECLIKGEKREHTYKYRIDVAKYDGKWVNISDGL